MDFIGIDIGGTKICTCLGNGTGQIYASSLLSTQSFGGSQKALVEIFKTIEHLLAKTNRKITGISAIGLSCPGPINQKKGMLLYPPNLKGWENTPIVQAFQDQFSIPVFFNNDANGAALAEWKFGNEKGVKNLVYLTASTGMGGGIIVNGELIQGVTDTAGEVGHYILDIHSPLITGGLHGTFEAFCGGKSVADQIQTQLKEQKIDTKILELADHQMDQISTEHLIEAVRLKDPFAEKIWDQFVERFAQGIGILLMTLNPEAIVLGTIAIHSKDLLFDPLKKKLVKYAWKEPIEACSITASSIGDHISELSAIAIALYGLEQNS